MASSDSTVMDSSAESQARAQIREELAFLLRLTAAIQTPSAPNPNPNRNQELEPTSNTTTRVDTISTGLWTADVMEEPVDIPIETKSAAAPASQASIDAIPIVSVTEMGTECVICLELFSVGEEAREMTCKHKFHSGCIEKWLVIHGSCPVCRFVMPVDDDQEGSDNSGVGRDRRRRMVRFWLATRRNNRQSHSVSGSDFIADHGSGDSSSGLGEEEHSGDEVEPPVYTQL